MELIGLLILIAIGAYALGTAVVVLVGAGYFLSLPMLATLTWAAATALAVWLWRIHRSRCYWSSRSHRNRIANLKISASLTALALSVVWVVAAFQLGPVQHGWSVVSSWVFRTTE
jgi:hypothetical protein